MEQMLLVRCAPAYAAQIASYRQECLDTGSRMDGCGPLRRMEDSMDWVCWCQSWDTDGALPTDMDWVRTTQFLYIRASDSKMTAGISAIPSARPSGAKATPPGCWGRFCPFAGSWGLPAC